MKGLLFSPSAPNWCVLGTTRGASWVRTSLPDFLGPNVAVYSWDTFISASVSGHEARAPSQVRRTFHGGQLQPSCHQPLFWDLTLLEGAQSHMWGSTWASGGLLAPFRTGVPNRMPCLGQSSSLRGEVHTSDGTGVILQQCHQLQHQFEVLQRSLVNEFQK